MSTAKFNEWLNPDNTENYKTRAWVNFNGTGTVAIRASGNVASITDNGVGDYTINFATAMPDADYSTVLGQERNRASRDFGFLGAFSVTTSSYRITANDTNGNVADYEGINVAIFR